jgi:hypothetical protein
MSAERRLVAVAISSRRSPTSGAPSSSGWQSIWISSSSKLIIEACSSSDQRLRGAKRPDDVAADLVAGPLGVGRGKKRAPVIDRGRANLSRGISR